LTVPKRKTYLLYKTGRDGNETFSQIPFYTDAEAILWVEDIDKAVYKVVTTKGVTIWNKTKDLQP
jgi:hypothetical protein